MGGGLGGGDDGGGDPVLGLAIDLAGPVLISKLAGGGGVAQITGSPGGVGNHETQGLLTDGGGDGDQRLGAGFISLKCPSGGKVKGKVLGGVAVLVPAGLRVDWQGSGRRCR